MLAVLAVATEEPRPMAGLGLGCAETQTRTTVSDRFDEVDRVHVENKYTGATQVSVAHVQKNIL